MRIYFEKDLMVETPTQYFRALGRAPINELEEDLVTDILCCEIAYLLFRQTAGLCGSMTDNMRTMRHSLVQKLLECDIVYTNFNNFDGDDW